MLSDKSKEIIRSLPDVTAQEYVDILRNALGGYDGYTGSFLNLEGLSVHEQFISLMEEGIMIRKRDFDLHKSVYSRCDSYCHLVSALIYPRGTLGIPEY